MKNWLAAWLVLAAAPAVAAQEEARWPQRTASFYLGYRGLDEDVWWPVEDQGVVGIEYAQEPESFPLGFEVGLQFSSDDDDDDDSIDGGVAELYAGLHKSFGTKVRPVIGAGVSLVRARFEVGDDDDSDVSPAGYVHAGIGFGISKNISLGLDGRVLFGSDVELSGVDEDADYGQLALVLGVGF